MKQIVLEKSTLAACVRHARRGHVLVTRRGKPVALVVNVQGMDAEQLELGSSDQFWQLMEKRRK